MVDFVEPGKDVCIARHAQTAAGRQRNRAGLRTVRRAVPLVLLLKESAAEFSQPFFDIWTVEFIFKGLFRQIEQFFRCGSAAQTYDTGKIREGYTVLPVLLSSERFSLRCPEAGVPVKSECR